MTAVVAPSGPSAVNADRIAPAPDMSFFIWAWLTSPGLRAMPPESYMIPLPTSATRPVGSPAGVYVSFTIRGGSALPRLTPSRPPQPSSTRSSLSNTSTSNPAWAPRSTAMSAMSDAVM